MIMEFLSPSERRWSRERVRGVSGSPLVIAPCSCTTNTGRRSPFDVVGAKVAGLKAAFVDRAGKGWIDRLDPINVPSIVADGVEEAVKSILCWEEEKRQG
jgi:hypothetical protein